jgi:hypothetical protein
MSTLQATTLLPPDKKVVSSKIFAYTANNKYLDEKTIEGFTTIGDFNGFFLTNPDYFIHDCEIELEKNINILSHDDGEVHIQFTSNNSDQIIIDNIFDRYNLDKKLIAILKNNSGRYIAIDKNNNIIACYKNFDDYIENAFK